MGQAEWLMILTCAGYVAPYAWDRLSAGQRNRTALVPLPQPIRLEKRCPNCAENERTGGRHFDYCLGPPCPVSLDWWELYRESGATWAEAYMPQTTPTTYVITSGDKDCWTCVNIRTMRDREGRYECTGECVS